MALPALPAFLSVEWSWILAKTAQFRGKKPMSFITIHYLYMIVMSIVASILLFPPGGMPYIDALFFAAGASTQSGLNTIDLNKLNTYQQIVIYLIPMVTNPIFINTVVVFVRLYWFEKRFQHVVNEARSLKRIKSRSKTNTRGRDDREAEDPEQGVNGRDIVVLRDQGQPMKPDISLGFKNEDNENAIAESGSDSSNPHPSASVSSNASQLAPLPRKTEPAPLFQRNITFADQQLSPLELSPSTRVPQHISLEQHIAFLENQRDSKDKGTLRIPGPRESDLGHVPETVIEEEDTRNVGRQRSQSMEPKAGASEPSRQGLRKIPSRLTFRKTATTRSKGVGDAEKTPGSAYLPRRSNTFTSFRRDPTKEKDPAPYLSWEPTIGRNSAFVDLTEEQREELGGIEYRSLKTLAMILVGYFFFWHILGVVIFVPWIKLTDVFGAIPDAAGVSRAWWGIFTSATLFNDLGFTLTPDSMVSFQTAVLPLFLGSFYIVIGNTGFPCMLRFSIWLIGKAVPSDTGLWEEIKFLLDHPRRCFTLLFPSSATWVLLGILICLNVIDLIFFIILDLNDAAVTSINPVSLRVLNGLFQACSTRTAGTAVVSLSLLHPAIQVSYLIMMYISVFPIAISVRRTNVYEEKSLGIYGSVNEEESNSDPSYIGAHLRRQLSFDLWFIFLGLFIIAIAEGRRLQDPADVAFSLFSVLFEIVSAYGTVGLSLGYPTVNTSLSGQLTVISKLIIIAMMIRGRHRGLPYELDRAILLPSEGLHKKEDLDASKRARRMSNAGSIDPLRGLNTGETLNSHFYRLNTTTSAVTTPGMTAGVAHAESQIKGH